MKILESLIQLQIADLRVERVKDFIAHYDDQVKAIEDEKAAVKQRLEDEKAALETLKKQKAKLELDLQQGEEHINKCNARLYTVKTNKEYEGTLKEIEEQKSKNSGYETAILELMDRIDAEENKLAEARTKFAVEEKSIDLKKKELAQKLERAKARLPQEQKARAGIASEVKPDALELYGWLQGKLGPRVVARVVDEICQSCFRKVNSQMYNEALTGEHLVQCPGCNRILVYKLGEFLAGQDFEF